MNRKLLDNLEKEKKEVLLGLLIDLMQQDSRIEERLELLLLKY